MKLQYRKATPDDAQRVCYIIRHTKDVIYPDYYTQVVVEYIDRYYTFEIIKSDIEQGRTRVLVKEGEIIATGSRVDNHIMRVYVLPEYQGQGFGGMMMDELDALDGCRSVDALDVLRANHFKQVLRFADALPIVSQHM